MKTKCTHRIIALILISGLYSALLTAQNDPEEKITEDLIQETVTQPAENSASDLESPKQPSEQVSLDEDISITSQVKTPKKEDGKPKAQKKSYENLVRFDYNQEDLLNIINELAAKKGANIILPSGPNAINAKVTLHFDEKITLTQAWNMLYTLLEIAGYSLIPRGDMFFIIKNSPNTIKEPLPLYIGVAPDKLPNTDERIRYLYYLANIKVSDAPDNELLVILKELLPEGASIKIDVATNAILITEKASNIRQAMKVVTEVDKSGFQETMDMLTLKNTSADVVARLFNENILKSASQDNRYRIGARRQQSDATYFSPQTKIIPIGRTNSLIILGRTQAIERIRDFIIKYIDVPLDSGKSILHTYQLQYLDAEEFQGVLQRVVESGVEAARQSRGTNGSSGGPERFFEGGIIVKTDRPNNQSAAYSGSNTLIVACRNDDWTEIVKLLRRLDTPRDLVLLDVFIADITIEDLRSLASTTRNPNSLNFSKDVNIQSAQATGVVVDADVTTIAPDLLSRTSSPQIIDPSVPVPPAGTTLISLADANGKVWSVLEMLNEYTHTKVLSTPHVMALNNERAKISVGQTKLLQDESSGSAGATTIRFKDVTANLSVEIVPRISAANEVNLDVTININEFLGGANNRATRTLRTSANVKDTQALALGGLVKVDTAISHSGSPLRKIPIFGPLLFGARRDQHNKSNLTVFIAPKIVQAKLRGGISEHTKDYINIAKTYAKEGALFDSLRDPITRFFFKPDINAQQVIDSFMNKDEFKQTEFADAYAYKSDVQEEKVKTTSKMRKDIRRQQKIAVEEEYKEKKREKKIRLAHNKQNKSLKELVAHEENPFTVQADIKSESSMRNI